jgi:anti-sigma factor (TIGR02949 family)
VTTPIGCDEAVRRLWEFLDGGLDAVDHRQVEEHLVWCLRCCGELAFARELRGLLETRSEASLPGDVRRRLEGFIEVLGEDPAERPAAQPAVEPAPEPDQRSGP